MDDDRIDLTSAAPSAVPALPGAWRSAFRFCARCWMPIAPLRCCQCPPEPFPADATPARLLAAHLQLARLADAVARGRYRDDTATAEWWDYDFFLWRRAHGQVGEG